MKPALNPVDDQIVRRGWPDSPILAVCEFATLAILFWADVHHHIFISKMLYLFPLAWFSLRARGLRWRDVGLAPFRSWRTTLLIGVAAGAALEIFELFISISQPLLYGSPVRRPIFPTLVPPAVISGSCSYGFSSRGRWELSAKRWSTVDTS